MYSSQKSNYEHCLFKSGLPVEVNKTSLFEELIFVTEFCNWTDLYEKVGLSVNGRKFVTMLYLTQKEVPKA